MKVIGRSGSREFIVTMTEDELANMRGFASTYSDGYPRTVEVGSVYDVRKLFAEATDAIQANKRLRDAVTTLRKMSDKFLSFFENEERNEMTVTR